MPNMLFEEWWTKNINDLHEAGHSSGYIIEATYLAGFDAGETKGRESIQEEVDRLCEALVQIKDESMFTSVTARAIARQALKGNNNETL